MKKNKLPIKVDVAGVEAILGYTFKNKDLVVSACTHSSFANQYKLQSNERLEFLGDTVLSTIISEIIYHDKDYNEGQLSKLRSKIVSMKPLALIADNLNLSKFLLSLGKLQDEEATDNMKADLVEALIGAIYIDGGLESAKKFINKNFIAVVKEMEGLRNLEDAKSYLQEQLKTDTIKYYSTKTGTDHNPIFTATVKVNGVVMGKGSGTSKRIAETFAAEEALKKLTKV